MVPDLTEQLRVREQKGLLRQRQTLESPQETHVSIGGEKLLSFCSNDYLGLATIPR